MKTFLIIVGVVIFAGWFLIFQTGQRGDQKSIPPTGAEFSTGNTTAVRQDASLNKAPDFHLQDYDGKTVALADFAGKPLVINSWAAWCPFCRKELVDFAVVQKEFGDKVIIMAIDRQESLSTAKKYSDELDVTNDLIFLLDPSDSFYQSIGGFSMPETIFVDKDGRIADHKRGPMDVKEMRERIQKILN